MSTRPRPPLCFAAALLAATMGWSGCSEREKKPGAASTEKRVHLVVANLSGYTWQIALVSPNGERVQSARVPPHVESRLQIPGGDYLIEQALLNASNEPEQTRRFPMQLEAGETYRWPLATLRSGGASETARP